MNTLLKKGESINIKDACKCTEEYESVNDYAEFIHGEWRCRCCGKPIGRCRSIEPIVIYE